MDIHYNNQMYISKPTNQLNVSDNSTTSQHDPHLSQSFSVHGNFGPGIDCVDGNDEHHKKRKRQRKYPMSNEELKSKKHLNSMDQSDDQRQCDSQKPRRVRHAKMSADNDFTRHCVVCQDKAYNYNYGCICCESCKMFFRRNSWKVESLVCVRGKLGCCEMAVDKRRSCAACRLKKCLDNGMIREFNSYEMEVQQSLNMINGNKPSSPPPPSTTSNSTDLCLFSQKPQILNNNNNDSSRSSNSPIKTHLHLNQIDFLSNRLAATTNISFMSNSAHLTVSPCFVEFQVNKLSFMRVLCDLAAVE